MAGPRLIRGPLGEYRSWVMDSRRWQGYRPRTDDIIIATYPKCGTTWMQRIVSLLLFQSAEARPIMHISAWIDRRFGPSIEDVLAQIEAQQHRRFLKSHLPFDCLPFYDEVKYIHVARDGRDACMSYHNHLTGLTADVLERFDRIGLEDETIGRAYPRPPDDPAEFFHRWVRAENVPIMFYADFEKTWWEARHHANVLLVHYNDLKADLEGEMKRIARFLGTDIPSELWPELVAAAQFDRMRQDGEALMANLAGIFQGGSQRFFFKGSNDRWRGVFGEEDLALYEGKISATLPRPCRQWLAEGRLAAQAAEEAALARA
jgi:aryl sulfotransferase